jgi:hypothetical protein
VCIGLHGLPDSLQRRRIVDIVSSVAVAVRDEDDESKCKAERGEREESVHGR